ncbi:hypothetical protein ACHAW6_008736 [Cyclotella cf. meneghiniana]
MKRLPSHYASLALLILLTRTADCFAFHLTPQLAIRRGVSDSALSSKAAEVEEKRDVSKLPLPPNQGMNLYRNIRDSISYLTNPDRFVADRSAKLGPIFLSYQFFRPTVFLGGQKNVQQFISRTELKNSVVYPALPDTFLELHTKWGALNMDSTQPEFKEVRKLFGDVLSSREALEQYSEAADKEISEYVNNLAERVRQNPDKPIYLVPEIKSLCLQIFSKIFSGQGLTEEQEQQFNDYNDALLSISKATNQYKKGKQALDDLTVEMIRRFRSLDDPNISSDTPGKWYHDQIFDRPNFGDNEERISTGMILFIWGAYIECASLCVNSLALSYMYGLQDKIDGILKEYFTRQATGIPTSDPKFWDEMPYTNGICRETLRITPPGAGVPRFAYEDFELAGYRIPGEYPVMLDPRIGNMDPTLYTEPNSFEPLRWVPSKNGASDSSCPFQGTALNLGSGSWFPGGFGAHQCPGLPLAELVGRMFLTKMALKFDTWSFNGDGLTKDGEIDYVKIPVRIPPNDFGMRFTVRDQ